MEDINGQTVETNFVPPKRTLYKVIYFVGSAILIIGFILFVWRVFAPEKKVTTPKETASITAQELATKAGYTISWNGDSNDNTGRGIIVDDARSTSTTIMDSVALASIDQDPTNINFGLGVFKGWETIANSKDLYMLLENPFSKNTLKGRVTFEDSSFNFAYNKNIQTLFLVEDMNYGPTTKESFAEAYYFLVFQENSKEQSQKVIKEGDVIGIRGLLEDAAKQIVKKDNSGAPIIHKVYLRRFGGVSELFKELQ